MDRTADLGAALGLAIGRLEAVHRGDLELSPGSHGWLFGFNISNRMRRIDGGQP